ncbi:hypothetical protein ElyMa_000953800 [Elysia marginata]|uniref:Uncharacterized protein n=1 Tax=Elysia marginata TaxID=1093978 RepID=A0AAV4HGU3_9GAST|nr:hypothetical protein ElyMa_000953800 [Elysia marginata]
MDSTSSSFISITTTGSGANPTCCSGSRVPTCTKTLSFKSNTGRYILSGMLFTSALIPAVLLFSHNIQSVARAVPRVDENNDLEARLRCGSLVRSAIRVLQLERGFSAYFLSSGRTTQTRDAMLRQRVKVRRW